MRGRGERRRKRAERRLPDRAKWKKGGGRRFSTAPAVSTFQLSAAEEGGRKKKREEVSKGNRVSSAHRFPTKRREKKKKLLGDAAISALDVTNFSTKRGRGKKGS